MIISVASGKGGTGKTTIATNLAVALGKPLQFLDCDVEEPNAHLFLKPLMSQSRTMFIWRCRKLIQPDARFAASARKFASSTPSPFCPPRLSTSRNCAIAAAAVSWSVWCGADLQAETHRHRGNRGPRSGKVRQRPAARGRSPGSPFDPTRPGRSRGGRPHHH